MSYIFAGPTRWNAPGDIHSRLVRGIATSAMPTSCICDSDIPTATASVGDLQRKKIEGSRFSAGKTAAGDLIFGDLDGIVVIPRQHERAVIEKALVKADAENLVRRAVEAGMGATEAFNKYGVL